ncbi:hypothetical protein PCANC_23179 [Puccinia coronata f. sp. avenae]|uniref:Uncharacterized protein n=1 Tax=Puccinia coronata f. sp. avenae TaxID=200324 RepID=A0A2N5U0D7_9BASI|nr:hypothetical protein PCANC_23179 [Puccinia coronata f. sp. avenae]
MRAISSLLIIVAQLAIIECVWHSDDLMADGWGGEDNRMALERIHSFKSPSSSNHIEIRPLREYIGMHEQENNIGRLLFTGDVFHPLPTYDLNFDIRMQYIQKEMHRCAPVEPPKLVHSQERIRIAVADFMSRSFYLKPENSRPSAAACKELGRHFRPESIWMAVYKQRLGIDLKKAEEWLQITMGLPANRKLDHRVRKLADCFLGYIFFVDMILTIFPPSIDQMERGRSQSFHTAVDCFGKLTQEVLQDDEEFKSHYVKKKVAMTWTYLSDWMSNDINYKNLPGVIKKSEVQDAYKAYFNFIFAHSISSLTEKIPGSMMTVS